MILDCIGVRNHDLVLGQCTTMYKARFILSSQGLGYAFAKILRSACFSLDSLNFLSQSQAELFPSPSDPIVTPSNNLHLTAYAAQTTTKMSDNLTLILLALHPYVCMYMPCHVVDQCNARQKLHINCPVR